MIAENKNNIDNILKLYGIYLNDLKKYNTIIWQFPTALVTVNILAINYLLDKPHILFFISLVNFVLLHALFKHVHHQSAIICTLKKIEYELREHYDRDGRDIIPDFEVKKTIPKEERPTTCARCFFKIINMRIFRTKSAHLLSCSFFIFNIVFFLYTIWKIIWRFIDC